jgi:ribonuclease HI
MVALNSIQRKAWEISEKSKEERTQVQALSLAKECVINKMELLTDAAVVNDAITFVVEGKEKLKSKQEDSKESEEPDYNKREEKQKEETGERTKEFERQTTNRIF